MLIQRRRVIRMVVGGIAAAALTSCAPAQRTARSGTASETAQQSAAQIALVMPQGQSLITSFLGRAVEPGLQRIEDELGVPVTVSDDLQLADVGPALVDYGRRGYDLVILQGVSLQEPALEAAAEFPETNFVVVNGNAAQAPNLASVDFVYEEGGYLAGIVAGHATTSGRVAGIAPITLPPIERLLAGFDQGVKAVNPSAEVSVVYTGSVTDVAVNKQATLLEASRGADVVFSVVSVGDVGVFQATEEAGIRGIGYATDLSELGPESVVASLLVDYADIVYTVAEDFVQGEFAPEVIVVGLDDGVFDLTPYRHLPADVQADITAAVDEARQGQAEITVATP